MLSLHSSISMNGMSNRFFLQPNPRAPIDRFINLSYSVSFLSLFLLIIFSFLSTSSYVEFLQAVLCKRKDLSFRVEELINSLPGVDI